MTLEANEYPDIWQFSEECPSPKNMPTWVDADIKVREFIEVFLSTQFFGRVVIWGNSRFNRKIYEFEDNKNYKIIDWQPEAEEIRYYMENSCVGGGHLTVLFIPQEQDVFLDKILSTKHYGDPRRVVLGRKDTSDPLDWKHGQDINFLESDIFRKGHRIFTFSHDAEFLYEIFR